MGIAMVPGRMRSVGFPNEFSRLPRLLPPDIADASNPGELWMVCDDWHAPAIDGMVVHVRAPLVLAGGGKFGFFTDGISVPQLAWSLFDLQPFSMPELCGAIGHDIVYSGEFVDRGTCDAWLREWERMAGVSSARRNMMYWVVRQFGGKIWNQHTPEGIAAVRSLCQVTKVGVIPTWGKLPDGIVAA